MSIKKLVCSILGLLTFNSIMACPVCFDSNEESRMAYYLTTAFLSLFPLLMIGLLAFWLKKYSFTPNTQETS